MKTTQWIGATYDPTRPGWYETTLSGNPGMLYYNGTNWIANDLTGKTPGEGETVEPRGFYWRGLADNPNLTPEQRRQLSHAKLMFLVQYLHPQFRFTREFVDQCVDFKEVFLGDAVPNADLDAAFAEMRELARRI